MIDQRCPKCSYVHVQSNKETHDTKTITIAPALVAVSYGTLQHPALDLAAAALTSCDSDGHAGKAQNG